jgi:UDP-N-acetylmuramyl pentapeptide phosphotransferase/UDP-N-acetylglucosamine-1-phosphate transferase
MPQFPSNPYLLALAVSFAVALVLVWTRSWHGKYSFDTVTGVQKVHQSPVPRIGGVAVFLGFWSAKMLMPDDVIDVLEPSLAIGLIAFTFGLIEDLTKKVPVAIRLWATLLPGVVGYFLTGFSLKHFGFDAVDFLLQWSVVSVAFTAFAVCGMTHAMNMIDGFNGLAGWSAVWILTGIGAVALICGDTHLALVAGILLASTLGFLLVNWPWGRLFLGDGGSYFLGASIAWLCVALVNRNQQASPFACLLLCSYPVTEALYSIARRTKARLSSGQPDRMHLHQLVAMGLIYPKYRGKLAPLYKNSVTGFMVSLLCLPAILFAVLFSGDQALLITAFLINTLVYIGLYRWARARVGSMSHTNSGEHSPSPI